MTQPTPTPGLWGWVERHKVTSTVLGVVAAMVFIGSVSEDPVESAAEPSIAADDEEPNPEHVHVHKSADTDEKDDQAGPTKRKRHSEAALQLKQRPPTSYVVSYVVDGDTLELGNGERVRLVGIDTPEEGECGYDESKATLAELVEGEQVTLGKSDEDRDAYGRLLRYVDLGSVDAGLRLIEQGLAIARYDSRDGYGFHPREPEYIQADRGAKDLQCEEPRTVVQAPSADCAPDYSPCVPPFPPDVDCADVTGPVQVAGSDPHGLDADGDGIACE